MVMLSVSEAARRLGAKPKDISDLFYRRELSDQAAPIVAGRRLIPEGYLEAIRHALRKHGKQVVEVIDGTLLPKASQEETHVKLKELDCETG